MKIIANMNAYIAYIALNTENIEVNLYGLHVNPTL